MSLLFQRICTNTITRTGCNWLSLVKYNQASGGRLLPAINSRLCSQESIPPSQPPRNWLPIYHLPLVRWAAAFNKLKLYQASIVAVGTPAAYTLEQAGHLPNSAWLVFGTLGLSTLTTLTICSLIAQNLVGFLYLNETGNRMKLAYIDFWGRRKEKEFEINDMITDLETGSKWYSNFCCIISLQNEQGSLKFKLLQKFGRILEPYKFSSIFPDLR